MALLITGSPGSLFDRVSNLLTWAVAPLPATTVPRHCDPDETWPPRAGTSSDSQIILITNYPSVSFLDAVRDGGLTAVVVLDTSLRSYQDLRATDHDAAASIRNLSACATQLGELSGKPSALYLGPEIRDNPDAALRTIFAHAGWSLPAEYDAGGRGWPGTEPAHRIPLSHEIALVEGVLEPAFHFASTGKRRPITWPRSSLFWGDNPEQSAPAILELTGPARVVVFGPYFHIPPGDWIAQARFAFSPGARGAKLALEFHGVAPLARCSFQVEAAGRFQITLPIRVPSARETIELRLVLQSGAIEGYLGLDDIQLIPTGH